VSALARPGALATLLAGAALALNPSPLLARLVPAPAPVIATLLMLLALGLVARAVATRAGRAGAAVSAAGALVAVAGLAADGVLGHHGTLALAVGETATYFEEAGRDGGGLGLRPLGFPVAAEAVEPDGGVALMLPGRTGPVVLSEQRALRFGDYRLARPSAIEPGRVARIHVHREPAALAVLAGALLLAVGSALLVPHRAAAHGPVAPLVEGGGALVVALTLADRGAVLGWGFGVSTPDGRVALPGVGILLGLALVATLLGTLLLAARRLSGESAPVAVAGPARAALWLGITLAAAGVALAAVRVARLPHASPLAVVALGVMAGLLALALLSTGRSSGWGARALALLWPAAVVGALASAFVAGVAGLQREGTYATTHASAAASAALVGLAAVEPNRLSGVLRFAFVLALLCLALA
jgi:hypothetical protein